ncbi:unnamed protein product [Alopecurus aequalis]
MDRQSSPQRDDELLSRDQEDTTTHMAEGRTVLMDLIPFAPSLHGNDDFSEEQEQVTPDQGKFLHFSSSSFIGFFFLLMSFYSFSETSALVKHKVRMGTGLERLTRTLGTKVTIQIPEGMKRPLKPLHTAKFASEGGFIVRKHTPVLPHFKEYKKDTALMKNYVGKVTANFEVEAEPHIIHSSCTDMLQKISKNRRYRIKKDFFDPIPANELTIKSPVEGLPDAEWQALLKLWSTPRHKQTCASNKDNRAKVVFQQKTGSRSYAAHVYSTKEEQNGEELSAIDLFKTTHHSKKHGYSVPAQIAIAEMEKRKDAPPPEGQAPKSDLEIVAEVLKKDVKQSTFLVNVGLQSSKKPRANNAFVAAHVRHLEEKLERSELQTEVMREEVAAIKKRAEEAEAAQAARDRDYELLRKQTEEHDAKLAQLMALFGSKSVGS